MGIPRCSDIGLKPPLTIVLKLRPLALYWQPARLLLKNDMLGPFTLTEVLGAALTCILVLLTYRRSRAKVRKDTVAFVTASCVVVTVLLSLRFQMLPTMHDDLQLEAEGE